MYRKDKNSNEGTLSIMNSDEIANVFIERHSYIPDHYSYI